MKKALFTFENLVEEGQVPAQDCNAILFKNNCRNTTPTNTMVVNGSTLYEGDELGLSCDDNETDTTVYNVTFSGAGSSKEYLIIRKFSSDVRK
jgi:hypothetical protein